MYYKHSGRFTPGGLLLGVAAGAASAPLLAYAYGRGLILITEQHFAVFATIAFGAAIGAAVGYAFVWGKVRNFPLTWGVAGAASTLAWYLSWAVWESDILKDSEGVDWTKLAQSPAAVWRAACYINQYGTWANFANSPATKGLELWAIWIAEAAAVIGSALVIAHEIMKAHTFCERCDNWCAKGASFLLAPPKNASQLKLQLEANDLQSLEALGRGSAAMNHLKVKLNSCTHCRQFHTVTVTNSVPSRSRWGRSGISNKEIVHNLLISPTQAETLRQLPSKLTPSAQTLLAQAKVTAAGKR